MRREILVIAQMQFTPRFCENRSTSIRLDPDYENVLWKKEEKGKKKGRNTQENFTVQEIIYLFLVPPPRSLPSRFKPNRGIIWHEHDSNGVFMGRSADRPISRWERTGEAIWCVGNGVRPVKSSILNNYIDDRCVRNKEKKKYKSV